MSIERDLLLLEAEWELYRSHGTHDDAVRMASRVGGLLQLLRMQQHIIEQASQAMVRNSERVEELQRIVREAKTMV